MARKSNPKGKGAEELEFVFGFKQVFGLALLTALILSGTFFWGFSAGHKRALRGEPGPFAFLEKEADPHSAPVPIPEILLKQVDDSPAAGSQAEANPPSQPSGTPPAPGREPVAEDRVKPSPGAPSPETATTPAVPRAAPAPAAPVPQPVAAVAKPKRRIHYQVSALKVRENAKQLVDWLRSEGFPASIQPANDQGLFRVLVGPFRSDADAATARARLAKDGFKPIPRAL